jgi:hypothetical protein
LDFIWGMSLCVLVDCFFFLCSPRLLLHVHCRAWLMSCLCMFHTISEERQDGVCMVKKICNDLECIVKSHLPINVIGRDLMP